MGFVLTHDQASLSVERGVAPVGSASSNQTTSDGSVVAGPAVSVTSGDSKVTVRVNLSAPTGAPCHHPPAHRSGDYAAGEGHRLKIAILGVEEVDNSVRE